LVGPHGHDDAGETFTSKAPDAERDRQLLGFATALKLDTARLGAEHVPGALAREL
jgi:hypothetical protein